MSIFSLRSQWQLRHDYTCRKGQIQGDYMVHDSLVFCCNIIYTVFKVILFIKSFIGQIAVNNQHLVEYGHRLQPLKKIDTMKIMGDVRINQIRFQ